LENHLSELIARIKKHVGECDDSSLAVGSCIDGRFSTPWRSLQEDPLLQLPEPMDTQIAMLIDAYRSGQITRREFHEAMSLLKQETAVGEKKASRQASERWPESNRN
jgi:hypothetical protein